MAFRQVTVATDAVEVFPESKRRTSWVLKNYSGGTVFVHSDRVDITTKGFPLAVGDFLSASLELGDEPAAPLYAQMLAGSTDLRLEESFGPRIAPAAREA